MKQSKDVHQHNQGKYVIALDQGTTSSRAVVFDHCAKIVTIAQREFKQYYPQSGWVEHDPIEIYQIQYDMLLQAMRQAKITPEQVAAVGITNQRETTVVWHKETGQPIHNAIVWQCRRTSAICHDLKQQGWQDYVKEKTGLVIDPYFSATKIRWILDHCPQARQLAKEDKLLFGTIDTWLIWNLTQGKHHLTDYTNASRTMLFDIDQMQWDSQLLQELDIPISMMPTVKPSSGFFGEIVIEQAELDSYMPHHACANASSFTIPIAGVAGDQQAALYGQMCIEPGMAKNTYGTGCFLLMNTGKEKVNSNNGLLTTLACGPSGEPCYAIEGSVFMAGAAVQWLRDEIGLIASCQDSERFAMTTDSTDDVFIVPAFTGLGAPHWDPYAKGIIVGLTRGSHASHIIRATLESIAYQTTDVIHTMQTDAQLKLCSLRVDGGAVDNNFLMQFQADILNVEVHRCKIREVTALGAAYLAGIGIGFWQNLSELAGKVVYDRKFVPQMPEQRRTQLYHGWQRAVECAKLFARLENQEVNDITGDVKVKASPARSLSDIEVDTELNPV